MQNIMSIASFGAQAVWKNLKFRNFKNKLQQNKGQKHTIIGSNLYNPDFYPLTYVENAEFDNVEEGSVA